MARVDNGRLVGAAFLENPRLQRLLEVLDREGEEARAVGGALRNALMGVPVHEVDIATTALPQVTITRCKTAGLRTIPTGIEHGTVTVLVEGETFEVTTLREDVETDGRRAKVRFGRDFEADALRRDFTINAMSALRDGTFFDSVGGLADLGARRVRFIGDARTRIREDYLRILRFFRFHAAYGKGAPDRDGFIASIAERAGLDTLSRERVRAELLKLVIAPRAAEVAATMEHAGLLGRCLGGVAAPGRLGRLAAIRAGEEADAILALAALAVRIVEDAERLGETLRLSNAEGQRLAKAAVALAPWHGHETAPDEGVLRRHLFVHGQAATRDALALAFAEARTDVDDAAWRATRAGLAGLETPVFPYRAADLMERGVAPGPALGAKLAALRKLWMEAEFPKERERLEGLLAQVMAV